MYYIEFFLTFLVMCFALNCSFKDPGIVTFKTGLFDDIENVKIPSDIL